MEEDGSLSPEDVQMLTEWAVGADAELPLVVAVPEDDAVLLRTPAAPKRRHRKYRATYLRTREAKEGLQDEIEALEARLAVLKRRAGLEEERASVEQTAVQNAVLRAVVAQQHMSMAGAHSVLTRRLNELATHPLYTTIRLGKDWKARRQTVLSMRDMKLRNAWQYIMERSRGLDELQPHESQDVTQDEDGNVICSQFDVVQFTNARSIGEIFTSLQYFFSHEEIVLSERLGFLAIQDDFEMVDGIAINQRMYWIDGNGVTTEWNSVGFAQMFDGGYAVLTSDSVDEDERYPFQPATRVRRAWSGGILLSIAKKNDDGSVVVAMRRASITKLVMPHYPLTAEIKSSLVKSLNGWSEAMVSLIRAQLNCSSSPTSTG